MKIYYTMVLLTPKQFIDKLNIYDAIVLGALDRLNIKGLSNDFYTDKVLSKVKEDIPSLQVSMKPINKNRTLWLISNKTLESLRQLI